MGLERMPPRRGLKKLTEDLLQRHPDWARKKARAIAKLKLTADILRRHAAITT
jgi:hypothetical protein